MIAAAKREKERVRWKRNKRDQRARLRALLSTPAPLSPELVAMIEAERLRRVARVRKLDLWKWESADAAVPTAHAKRLGRYILAGGGAFAADVWAVRLLIEAELGEGKATPTTIAKELSQSGRWPNHKLTSLRTMVYKALGTAREQGTIALLQNTLDDCGVPYWGPFNPEG